MVTLPIPPLRYLRSSSVRLREDRAGCRQAVAQCLGLLKGQQVISPRFRPHGVNR